MKDLKNPKDPVELMGQAYERLLETAMEDVEKLEHKTGPALHKLIDKAREKLSELGEFSEEELDKVSEYLKRDLRDAAEYIAETGEDIATWLGFDLKLIGDRLLELFSKAADQTTVELNMLREQAELAGYHTGEMRNSISTSRAAYRPARNARAPRFTARWKAENRRTPGALPNRISPRKPA